MLHGQRLQERNHCLRFFSCRGMRSKLNPIPLLKSDPRNYERLLLGMGLRSPSPRHDPFFSCYRCSFSKYKFLRVFSCPLKPGFHIVVPVVTIVSVASKFWKRQGRSYGNALAITRDDPGTILATETISRPR